MNTVTTGLAMTSDDLILEYGKWFIASVDWYAIDVYSLGTSVDCEDRLPAFVDAIKRGIHLEPRDKWKELTLGTYGHDSTRKLHDIQEHGDG